MCLLRRLYGQFNIVTVSVTPLEAVNVPASKALRAVKQCKCCLQLLNAHKLLFKYVIVM